MDVHHDLYAITEIAKQYAREHKVNYNIILSYPDENGEFQNGSTYEFVTNSYFENGKERNCIILHKTDDLLKEENEAKVKEEIDEFIDHFSEVPRFIDPRDTFIEPYDGIPVKGRNRVPVVNTKIGRNAPCPCGSGKKHKKCCLI